jgi:hypothetical protein
MDEEEAGAWLDEVLAGVGSASNGKKKAKAGATA